ncbi:hypothetical protein SCHPADRAFT_943680 [Schizopora paradoxa]|uniref:Uncharacterized protein n=1 Tax=Schizopora paradoxa TaxID=27342 RepID=A0A0H2RCY4_9AGAM|nr:hypothetical protein SCHPADRAFT_943680 [Schizopora paradoxa]
MASNLPSCPPSMNTDISGIGVRISFYVQTLILVLLTVCSEYLDDVEVSLLTLSVTNMAMVVTSLILGFQSNPQITLQDGIIVFYLLAMSWVAVIFSTTGYIRFKKNKNVMKFLAVFQCYFLLLSALVFLAKSDSFGSSPTCNSEAMVVLFRPFRMIHVGRNAGLVVVVFALVGYSVLTILDYSSGTDEDSHSQHSYKRRSLVLGCFPKGTILKAVVFVVIWVIAVVNTELLIRSNKFSPGGQPQWQFGQVLPMFLVVLPLLDLVKMFKGETKRTETNRYAHSESHHSHHSHHGGHGQIPMYVEHSHHRDAHHREFRRPDPVVLHLRPQPA